MAENYTEEMDRKIDKGITGALAISSGHGGGAMAVMPRTMTECMEFSKLMALAGPCIRPVFRGSPGSCLAIVLQSLRWGFDPFTVANKAYMTTSRGGDQQIAFEAQLLHAVVNESSRLTSRLRPEYSGEGTGRRCRIVGYIRGETEPFEYISPPISQIAVKNSPLWTGDPDQQLFYYSTRAWSRRHLPEVLLGAFTPDEAGEIIDMVAAAAPEPEREVRPPYREQVASAIELHLIDLDGVESTWHSVERAVKAAELLLDEAAGVSREALDGFWETNQALVEELQDAGFEAEALELTQAYVAKRDRPQQRQPEPPPQPDPPTKIATPARRRRAAANREPPPQQQEEPPPQQEPPQQEEPPIGDPPVESAPEEDSRAPLTVHDNMVIAPPMERGKPNYRLWAVALFVPRIKRCLDQATLSFFLGDNAEHLEQARNSGLSKDDREQMEGAIAAQQALVDRTSRGES